MQIESLEEFKVFQQKIQDKKIDLLVATDHFLKYFWTSVGAEKQLKTMRISPMYFYTILLVSSMRFLLLFSVCLGTIFYFKWWSPLVIILLILLFGIFLNITAKKKTNMLFGIIVAIIGILIALSNHERGLWFQVIAAGICSDYFFMVFTQRLTNIITSHLLLTNYEFFQFFQPQRDKLGYPFFYMNER